MQTELGVFLRQYRADNNITQTRLEETLGKKIRGGYISRIESGAIQCPDDGVLRKLAVVTGRRFEELKAMCHPIVHTGAKLRMACGYSLWNAPICCAVGEGLLPNLKVGSFYKSNGPNSIPSENLQANDLEWIKPFSAEPEPSKEGVRLVPLSAADVASLLHRGQVEIGALPGNLVREGILRERLICIGTMVDSASGCHFVHLPTFDKSFPEGRSLSTRELGERVADYPKKPKQLKAIRIGAEEKTIAAEYLDQACSFQKEFDRYDIVWNYRASDLKAKTFGELSATCRRQEDAELMGIIVWEPLATWLVKNSLERDKTQLGKIPMHFSPIGDSGKQSHLTYEVVIARSRLAEPTPLRRDLFDALRHIMNSASDTASVLNIAGRATETTMRKLADFYGFSRDDMSGIEGDQAIQETTLAIDGIMYSVRWNVIPELGIGPQI